MSKLRQISVNDSVYHGPDLLFAQRGKQHLPGWKTVLMPTNLRTGKNTIRISLVSDSLLFDRVVFTTRHSWTFQF
jgi:hypothetical protein